MTDRIEMDIPKLLHMNEGVGETSYAHNSSLQGKVLSMSEPAKKEAISRMYQSCFPLATCLSIADLGCSSGPNALLAVHQLITAIDDIRRELGHRQSPDIQLLLNDLPRNDFNTLFQSLPSFQKQLESEVGHRCFISGVPGSFYGRLFPSQSLHFVHSSCSLHWLSRVPHNLGKSNKGEVCLSSSSPESVVKAYLQQFRDDFSTFLKCRSEEMVAGGGMVFTLPGRENDAHFIKRDATYSFILLSLAISQMVSEGLIEEEKLDMLNFPVYMPSPGEIRREVEKEGSFAINNIQVSEVGWEHATTNGEEAYMRKMGAIRAGTEPLLVVALGEQLMDEVFRRYAEILRDVMAKEKCVWINLTVSLTKLI